MEKRKRVLINPAADPCEYQILFLRRLQELVPDVVIDLRKIFDKWKFKSQELPDPDDLFADPQNFVLNFENVYDENLLAEMDAWNETWNLDRKSWIYNNVILTFQAWANSQAQGSITLYFQSSSPVLAPEVFTIPEYNFDLEESGSYRDRVFNSFRQHLDQYIDESHCLAETLGYKWAHLGRPQETEHVEWLVRHQVQSWNYGRIADVYGRTSDTIRKGIERLDKYDLPCSALGKNSHAKGV